MPRSHYFLPLLVSGCSTSALAAIDCSTMVGNTAGAVTYSNQGSSRTIDVELLDRPTVLNACGFNIRSDANSYSFQARDPASLSKLFGGEGLQWPVLLATINKVGGETAYSLAATLSLTLPPDAPKGIRVGGSFSGDLSAYSEIVVRADGGKLQTLLKDVRFTPLYFNPKTTRRIEVYVKSPHKLNWTHMTFDVKAAKLTFDKTFAYPSK